MSKGNRFKDLSKDKTKEIVGSSIKSDEVSVTITTSPTEESLIVTSSEDYVDGEPKIDTIAKSTKKVVPLKKLRDNNTKKPEYIKIGINVKESSKNKIDTLADDNDIKPNDVVVDLLKRLFDGKSFTTTFEKKDKTKVTSYNIPGEMEKAITKLNKKTGLPKSEIFNKLIEESLKDFF